MQTTEIITIVGRAIVASEQGSWDLDAEHWDEETLRVHGIWGNAEAAIKALEKLGATIPKGAAVINDN